MISWPHSCSPPSKAGLSGPSARRTGTPRSKWRHPPFGSPAAQRWQLLRSHRGHPIPRGGMGSCHLTPFRPTLHQAALSPSGLSPPWTWGHPLSPEGPAQLVVVHLWLALPAAPEAGHLVRVLDDELPVLSLLPGDDVAELLLLQQLQDEVPQLDLPRARGRLRLVGPIREGKPWGQRQGSGPCLEPRRRLALALLLASDGQPPSLRHL